VIARESDDDRLPPERLIPDTCDLVPSLLTTSDVLGTAWFAAEAANMKPGSSTGTATR
jgi:hypothetical protein